MTLGMRPDESAGRVNLRYFRLYLLLLLLSLARPSHGSFIMDFRVEDDTAKFDQQCMKLSLRA
jgi:hypothetical protein